MVLNEINQRFALPSLRSTFNSLRSWCWQCKCRNIKPDIPEMKDLPRSSLAVRLRPFTYTGVNYFGLIMVKHQRHLDKRCWVLFTHLITRAIHIKLTPSLFTNSFVLVLRSFITRRGTPNRTKFLVATELAFMDYSINCAKWRKRTARRQSRRIINRWHMACAPHMRGA